MDQKPTRQRIIEEADRLFYQRGFEHTSFADIAEAVHISRGNFYHHFKTKDDILGAVIQYRLTKTQMLLDKWEQEGETPEARIDSFITILIMNKTKIKQWGCPVGTLCTELAKLHHVAQDDANQIFTLFRKWLRKQFRLMACEKDADALAMHVLARSQGVATLANAFDDDGFIRNEVRQIQDWLHGCTTKS